MFAYGQTGTGKTYTMEGGMRKKVSHLDFHVFFLVTWFIHVVVVV